MIERTSPSRSARIVVVVMGVVIAVAGVYGFGSKFEEFVHLARRTDEGGFALVPVLNYMLAAAGFVCLFIWALRRGMLRDVEKPKYDMLDRERELDRRDGIEWKD